MTDEPKTTRSTAPGAGDETPPKEPHTPVGGDQINIGGNVLPGAVVGSGSSQIGILINGGLNIGSGQEITREHFVEMLKELRSLVARAEQAGELEPGQARQALKNLEEAVDMATHDKPPKTRLLAKLTVIADLLDAAASTADLARGALQWLVKAVPVAAILVELAQRLF
jgi:hypothetical protein